MDNDDSIIRRFEGGLYHKKGFRRWINQCNAMALPIAVWMAYDMMAKWQYFPFAIAINGFEEYAF